MSTLPELPAGGAPAGVRSALIVAVAGSAGAGLIHAAAARSHDGEAILVWLFAGCALAQIAWAAVAARRPSRRVLAAGVALNATAVIFWGFSRSIGIPFLAPLRDAEGVGAQDLSAALFAAASVGGAVCMLVRPVVRAVLTPAWAGALAVVALLAAMPALSAGHTHDPAEHQLHLETAAAAHEHGGAEATTASHDATGHPQSDTVTDHASHSPDTSDGAAHAGHDTTGTTGAGHDHGTTDTTGTSHEHGTTDTTAGTSHDHGTTATTVAGHDHTTTTIVDGGPTGPIISLDDPRVTAAQRAIAVKLISDARTALSAYPNVAAVEAAGYTSIGDGGSFGFEHYVKWAYLTDGRELDPAHMESIVVKKNGTSPKQIVSAMYILNLGKTMANTPVLAGELTSWHLHDNLCFSGTSLVGIAVNGVCATGSLLITPPMLHVWLIERPCGPFAGLEADGEICASHQH